MSTKSPDLKPFFEASAAFGNGSDTPRAFLERRLEALAEREPHVGAFVVTNLDDARAAADGSTARWQAGRMHSPIDGMPIGVKDIMETADMPTEQGSPLFAGWRMGRDCAAVAALREAGGVIVGKTVTTEFAATVPRGTRNPCDPARTPGGSSSGSAAAVAAGMISAALGSQVIGSILRPASYCGAFGYKPSVGSLNRGGSFDGFSQSCTGVLAASLADAWCVARAISSRVGGDPGYPGLSGPITLPEPMMPRRIAVLETAGWAGASDSAKSSLRLARSRLERAGIVLCDRSSHAGVAAAETAIAEAGPLSRAINAWESRWPLNTYARDMDESKLSNVMRARLAEAETMTQEDYQNHLTLRLRVRECYAELKSEFDLCISLAAPDAAPVGLNSTGDPAFAIPSSLLGAPSLSLPVFILDDLPLGLQAMGFADADAALFAAAMAILSTVEGRQPA